MKTTGVAVLLKDLLMEQRRINFDNKKLKGNKGLNHAKNIKKNM